MWTMASWATRIIRISFLLTLMICFVIVADASVTWRRVNRPSLRPREPVSKSNTTSSAKSATKSPVTWKRSTISRRSTDEAEKRAASHESEELDGASSGEEHAMGENDSEVKPLIPGSRPGFWFDSSRRKKPASLLRPGTRRNSLFPTRTSTSTTSAPITVQITPSTVVPRTLPPVTKLNSKNTITKNFGRNRSTNSPISFRRRLKTSRAPKTTSTANPFDIDEDKNDEAFIEFDEQAENEMVENDKETEELSKQLKNNEDQTTDIKSERPKLNIRRPYNGTRLSWTRQNSRHSSRTTATPQQLTTSGSPTSVSKQKHDNIPPKTTVFPRTKTRSKTKTTIAPEITWSRKKQTTVTPTSSTISSRSSEKVTTPRSITRNKNNFKSDNNKHISKLHNEEKQDFIETSTQSQENDYGLKQDSSEFRRPKVKTTVEPFYITREYGRIATAIPEVRNNKENAENTTEDLKTDKELIPTAEPKESENVEYVAPETPALRKGKKRIRTKTTEVPKLTTTTTEKAETFEREYDYENVDIDTFVDDIEDFKSRKTFTSNFTTPDYYERFSEKVAVDPKVTTTVRPVMLSAVPTIDPNSNAYVVWSLGHGGSGWSYQKHGGQVKWSAQNSEAEGDSWSVVGRNEEENENIEDDLKHQWIPIRNPTLSGYENSEKLVSKIKKDKSVSATRKMTDAQKATSSVLYTPTSAFKNETVLNFKKIPDITSFPYQITNSSFRHPALPVEYFAVNSLPPMDSKSSANTSLHAFIQEPNTDNLASQTPLPVSPTLESEFNEQVEGIINQYPIVPNYPYIAEIRDRDNNLHTTVVANAPSKKFFDVQEYVNGNVDVNIEKEPTTPLPILKVQQFSQEPQAYPYPTTFAQPETLAPYIDFNEDSGKRVVIANQPPVSNTQKYISGIPPELAKAVVQAKKWRVEGSGGDEGWSLLNDSGILEWKIHNVDGHWRVSSAEQLTMSQPSTEQPTNIDNDEKSAVENYRYNAQASPQDLPKVWTLEDDYEKWRAVSTERGTPTDVSSEEASISSQEYEYGSQDYNGDYYSDEDYYNSNPVNADIASYDHNEDYGNRPLWGNGENQMTYSNAKEDYPQFARNVEIANSREDAIAAWKSLVTEQGHWKLSDNRNGRYKTYPQEKPILPVNTVRNANRRVSTLPPRPQNDRRKQDKFQETNDQNSETVNMEDKRENIGSGQPQEAQLSIRGHGSKKSYKLQEMTNGNNEYLIEKSSHKHGYHKSNHPKETNSPIVRQTNENREKKDKLHEPNYESIIESIIQKYSYRGRNEPEEPHLPPGTILTGRKDERKQQIKKYPDVTEENYEYQSKNTGQKYNGRNPEVTESFTAVKNANEHKTNKNFLGNNYESNSGSRNDHQDYKQEHPYDSSQKYDIESTKQIERNREKLPETRNRMKYPEVSEENYDYATKHSGQKYNSRNPAEADPLPTVRHVSEPKDNKHFQGNNYESNSGSRNKHHNYEQEHTYENRPNHDIENSKKTERKSEKLPDTQIHAKGKDHSKIETLINKLETIQREAKGRAVIDLTELLKQIKSRHNISSATHSPNNQLDLKNHIKKTNNYPEFSSTDITERDDISNLPERKYPKQTQKYHQSFQRDIQHKTEKKSSDHVHDTVNLQTDYNKSKEHFRSGMRSQNHRARHSKQTNDQNRRKSTTRPDNKKIENQSTLENSNNNEYLPITNQNIALNRNERIYPPARTTEQYSREKYVETKKQEENAREAEKYSTSGSINPSKSRTLESIEKSDKSDSSSSDEIIVDLRDNKRSKSAVSRRQRRPTRKRSRRPSHPAPIVLKGETEVENDENGSRKNRKIIVIDYAGAQKKKSSVDKKDLELIIKNVKHRRSEVFESIGEREH